VRTFGALSLYLDFINIFVSLLQLFGGKRDWWLLWFGAKINVAIAWWLKIYSKIRE
jgi:hypothetical protein